MKYGLILCANLKEASDWKFLNQKADHWNSLVLDNGATFFTTVSVLVGKNMLDSDLIENIDSKIEGSFGVSLLSLNRRKVSIEDIQRCINKGLESCKEAGLMHTVICDYRLSVGKIERVIKADKLACLSTDDYSKSLDPSFMFGKTRTLRTIWKDMPFLRSRSVNENVYRAFANVAGQDLGLMNSLSPESADIRRNLNIP